ncbi:MAG: AmmeMemoRadiSam system protein B [Deltaproteobacteria bacterium]|nr:AmmeMemoRadiSam system protein B [Deltaproteobacteria bacterium]
MLRQPAVAGSFYPAERQKLEIELKRCLAPSPQKKQAIGIVSPHAGYHYSGTVAGQVYSQIELPQKMIILSPNHTGYGLPASIWPEGEWETPLGKAPVDVSLSLQWMKNCPLLQKDTAAHIAEHSLEVQIPFLQSLKRQFTFVPVTLSHLRYSDCHEIGRALAQTIQGTGKPVLIIASSDMNHYENQEITHKKDLEAIEKILALDPQGLYETVHKKSISMCGIIPTTVMLVAAKELGARKAELVQHATSGDVTHDYKSVVGYAGLIIS